MSKLRARGTLVTLVLFAAVAVFPSVVQAPSSKKVTHSAVASGTQGGGILIADGGDPVPGPSPIPWGSAGA
jgi:hypothetical protein